MAVEYGKAVQRQEELKDLAKLCQQRVTKIVELEALKECWKSTH